MGIENKKAKKKSVGRFRKLMFIALITSLKTVIDGVEDEEMKTELDQYFGDPLGKLKTILTDDNRNDWQQIKDNWKDIKPPAAKSIDGLIVGTKQLVKDPSFQDAIVRFFESYKEEIKEEV